MHGISHNGMVLLGVLSLYLLVLIRVKHWVVDGLVVYLLVHVLLYYVSLCLDC